MTEKKKTEVEKASLENEGQNHKCGKCRTGK